MDWVKKNWILLACGLLALAGIGIGVWSYMGFQEVQTKANEIAAVASRLQGTRSDPANEAMIDQAKKYFENANKDSVKALDAAKSANKRAPLMDDVFPVEKRTDSGYNFRIEYRKAMQELPDLIKGGKAPNTNDVDRIVSRLADKRRKEANLAGTGGELKVPKPPTVQPWAPTAGARPAEERMPEERGGYDERRSGYEERRSGPDERRGPPEPGIAPVYRPGATPSGSPQASSGQGAEQMRPDAKRAAVYQAAKSIWTYLNDDSFQAHPIGLPDSNDKPRPEDLWAAQMFLWIDTDIAQALRRANEQAIKARNLPADQQWVAYLPVKHLISLRISEYLGGGATGGSSGGADTVRSNSISALYSRGGAAPMANVRFGQEGIAFTNHARTADYDVVHVALNLVVDPRDLPQVLLELCKQNFITPLQVQYRAVDATAATNAGYLYGSGPLVNVDIVCEVLFFRSIYGAMMPQAVKDLLEGKGSDRGATMH